ncbi:MAG: hypothetical protein OSJ63_05530 [Bacilli bacterium]|nr:hypothetical protein [Bacilli bacterium]
MKVIKKYSCDFETTTDEEDCRVWAVGICEIGNIENFIYYNNIKDFITWCEQNSGSLLYFHNLKFDGEFIFQYLLNNEFTWIKDKKEKKDKTFTCLISDMGMFYSIEIYFKVKGKNTEKITIYDSLKVLNFNVKELAKNFNLPILKGEIDYKQFRSIGHNLTKEEISYLRNDVEIVARCLEYLFNENLTKMTIGSCALNWYKESFKSFEKMFPKIPYEIDQNLRNAYKGGFTYLNPIYKEKIINEPIAVFDVNSLYPSVMYNELLPIGPPVFFTGQYEENTTFPLYIQQISCEFKLKPGKIPTIQIKHSLHFIPNEYLESSNGEITTLYLTNIDLKLFLEHYEVDNLTYESGFMFQGMRGMFCDYIDFWKNKKNEGKKLKNKPKELIPKLMLNALYGKFSKTMKFRQKYPCLEEGIIKYKLTEEEIVDGCYLPMGIFITSYARNKTIRSSQKIKDYSIKKYGIDKYIYSDTDSIHTTMTDLKEISEFLEVDKYKLGAWKFENEDNLFTRGKFLRQKCYIEEAIVYNEEKKKNEKVIFTTIAGLPKELGKNINFKNFNTNFTCNGKLRFKHVKGGVVLVDTPFSIK